MKLKFNITQLENVEIDLKVVESGLLLKPIKKNRREDLAKNINQILENSKNKEKPLEWVGVVTLLTGPVDRG